MNDRANCGSCGHPIGAEQSCVNGQEKCVGTQHDVCGAACVDLETDPNNCGACGKNVPADGGCYGGVVTCYTSMLCGNACIDTANDFNNCGSCGHACPPGTLNVCSGGMCF